MSLLYQVIPEPRCLKNIQERLERGRYKDAMDVYTELSLVFWNALFYNEPISQIAADAESLKVRRHSIFCLHDYNVVVQSTLVIEWKKRSVLPIPPTAPPASSAQRVHGVMDTDPPEENTKQPKKDKAMTPLSPQKAPTASFPAPPTRPATPAPAAPASPSKTAGLTRSKSVKAQTPDLEVEVVAEDEGQEEEGPGNNRTERDPLSEEIVKQLERSLPRWPGLSDEGWLEDMSPVSSLDFLRP